VNVLAPHAESVESVVLAAVESVSGETDGVIRGTARIVSPDGFGSFVLVPAMAELRTAHPELALELVTSTTHDLISARHYDVAVTLEYPPPRAVAVTELARYRLQFYASSAYLNSHRCPQSVLDLQDHPLIWYIEAFLDVEPLRELYSLMPNLNAQFQTNNITGQYLAARAGLGIALLPNYIGNADPDLELLLGSEISIERRYWIVVPRDLDRLPRVRAVVSYLNSIVQDHPDLLAPDGRS
jgi:DNA-binding transcriptional LysR family regulator